MEQERRKGEVIDAVDLAGNVDLLLVVGVNLNKGFEAPLCALFLDTFDQSEGLRNHEARCTRFLRPVAYGVEAN